LSSNKAFLALHKALKFNPFSWFKRCLVGINSLNLLDDLLEKVFEKKKRPPACKGKKNPPRYQDQGG
jgi:hypothetical protein